MSQRQLNAQQIAVFQSEFLRANNVEVPESFFATNEDIYDFLDGYLPTLTHNIKGAIGYNAYTKWCVKNKYPLMFGKHQFYAILKEMGVLRESATIDGVTVRNVIVPSKEV